MVYFCLKKKEKIEINLYLCFQILNNVEKQKSIMQSKSIDANEKIISKVHKNYSFRLN